MIYVTGDTHGEFRRFTVSNFPKQLEMNKEDFVIICGDFGGIWEKVDSPNDGMVTSRDFMISDKEQKNLQFLDSRPFTTLFVDGNHENHDRLDAYETIDLHGGKAHKISNSVYHLLRGEVYELQGKKFFTFGGARSHDIDDGILDEKDFETKADFEIAYYEWNKQHRMFRVNHISWWEREMPSQGEMKHGLEMLNSHNNKVDFIITHDAPSEACITMGYETDELSNYLQRIFMNTKFHKWHFGHYHREFSYMGKLIGHYYDIERIV